MEITNTLLNTINNTQYYKYSILNWIKMDRRVIVKKLMDG